MRLHTNTERGMTRGWLYVGDYGRMTAKYELHWRVKHFLFNVGFNSEDSLIGLTWAIPFLHIHLAVAWPRNWLPRGKYHGDIDVVRITIHNGAIWWNLWRDSHGWDSEIPKWRDGNFNPADFLIGQRSYSAELVEQREVWIEMPEAKYLADAKLMRAKWKRPRWPFPLIIMRAEIECKQGVPFPGKGENSWDCGEDATHGMTTPAESIEEGVRKLTESVMNRRNRYGGPNWRPEKAA